MPFDSFVFQPFLQPVSWNIDVMAGTLTFALKLEAKGSKAEVTLGLAKTEVRSWVTEDVLEQNWHASPGLPRSRCLCKKVRMV